VGSWSLWIGFLFLWVAEDCVDVLSGRSAGRNALEWPDSSNTRPSPGARPDGVGSVGWSDLWWVGGWSFWIVSFSLWVAEDCVDVLSGRSAGRNALELPDSSNTRLSRS
jgi:hypothetical protein